MQTPSTWNCVADRIWSKVDICVYYPIKLGMNDIAERINIDLSDPMMKYYVSSVTIHVSKGEADPEILKRGGALCRPPWLTDKEF